MATQVQVSMAEYMATSYRPDREYIDGELRERNVGKYEHARVQALLTMWLGSQEKQWGVMVTTEQRTLTAGGRIRIPDIAVLATGTHPEVISAAPLLVIEILSPDDSYTDTQQRAADYQQMGVGTIWIIDPYTRTGRVCVGASWTSADRLEVPGTPIHVNLREIFDRIQASAAEPAG